MANSLYGQYRQACLEGGGVAWLTDDIKVMLVDTATYTVAIDVDRFLSDVPAPARIATSSNLTNKTSTLGVADADDVTFTAVPPTSVEAVVLYQDTGVAGTSRLIMYVDTAPGLPLSTNGGDVTLPWSNGASKIFKL